MTVIPESAEVIDQTVEDLIDLYVHVCRGGDQRPLADLLDETATDPERVLRVGLVLADMVAAPLRKRLDLEDPQSGLYLRCPDHEPGPGELVAEEFVNLILRERYDQAQDCFIGLTLSHEEQIRNFLGLLLALVSV